MTVQMQASTLDQLEATLGSLRQQVRERERRICDLAAEVQRLAQENNDQCDQIEDLRKALRSRELMIEELRSLIGGAQTERPEAGQ